jgi:hypothetical protein
MSFAGMSDVETACITQVLTVSSPSGTTFGPSFEHIEDVNFDAF